MSGYFEELSRLVGAGGWLAPFIAFLAGILSSFMPCSLAGVSLVIGYVGNVEGRNLGSSFRLSVTFAAGAAVMFTALGIVSSLAGRLLGVASRSWFVVMGALMVMMSLQTWGLFEFIPASRLALRNTRRGYAGAFIAGALGGLFSSPCSTPVLVALLAAVSSKASMLGGMFMLLMYSAGHGILAVAAGTSTGLVRRMSSSKGYARASAVLKAVMGAIIMMIGFYMFYLGF